MSSSNPEPPIGEKALEELRRHYGHLQSPSTAEQAWERYLSAEERAQLGGDLSAAYEDGALVGIWMRLHNVSEGRAIIELAQRFGWATDADADWLFEEIGENRPHRQPTSRPVWNEETGDLTFRGMVVRHIEKLGQAKNIVRILNAFQEEDWPSRIDDPLDPDPGKQRLPSAIKSLNKRISVIRFHSDGCGEGICWSLQGSSAT